MKDLPIKDQALSYLTVEGWSNEEIADALKLPLEAVRLKLTDERIREKMRDLEYKLTSEDVKKRLNDMLPKVIDGMEEVIDDPSIKPNVKISLYERVLDQTIGKPKQVIEHEGSLVRAYLERLNQTPQVEAVPVEFKEVESESNPIGNGNPNEARPLLSSQNPNLQDDPIDSWAKQNLGKG